MRTTKNILMGLSLLLGAALMIPSAQAAEISIVANPLVGRAGGGAEKAGVILLRTDTLIPMVAAAEGDNPAVLGIGFISLRFSVDVVSDPLRPISIMAVGPDVNDQPQEPVETGATGTASGKTVTLKGNNVDILPMSRILIDGVFLNLIGKTGTVTATLSLTGNNFPEGTSVTTVISSIEEPLTIGDDKVAAGSIRPSGGKASATFTIEEGFAGAFEDEGELRLQILNVPENAVLTISSGITTTFANGVVWVNSLALDKAAAAVPSTGEGDTFLALQPAQLSYFRCPKRAPGAA